MNRRQKNVIGIWIIYIFIVPLYYITYYPHKFSVFMLGLAEDTLISYEPEWLEYYNKL